MATPKKKPIDLAIPLGTSAFNEVNKLATFLLEQYPDECREEESAVDVVIRLIALHVVKL